MTNIFKTLYIRTTGYSLYPSWTHVPPGVFGKRVMLIQFALRQIMHHLDEMARMIPRVPGHGAGGDACHGHRDRDSMLLLHHGGLPDQADGLCLLFILMTLAENPYTDIVVSAGIRNDMEPALLYPHVLLGIYFSFCL